MSEWISVDDRLPESSIGCWSSPVIAICDAEIVYKLSHFNGEDGGCWQRPASFANNMSKKVIGWMPLPNPPENRND